MLAKEIDQALRMRHGDAAQERLYDAHVAIAGAGGIGSHTAYLLARAGVGHLHLIDFDEVELHNLHRQQYRIADVGAKKADALKRGLLEIHPFLDIKTTCERVTEENMKVLFAEADLIVEAFDRPEEKAMLVNYVLSHFPDKALIVNSGMAGFSDSNRIHTRKCRDNFYICGDESSDVNAEGTLFASRVSICAGHAANLAIQLIIENGEK